MSNLTTAGIGIYAVYRECRLVIDLYTSALSVVPHGQRFASAGLKAESCLEKRRMGASVLNSSAVLATITGSPEGIVDISTRIYTALRTMQT